MNKLILAMAMLLPFVVSTANAAPAKAPLCAACHGAEGKAMIPGYPHLAGQNEQYLISSLKAYKDKQRNGGQAAIMQAQAAALSDAEIAELAAYFSKM
ncbi:c-type cytochrome [Agarivorans sp. TSD2052]|uniref:c-type cytochrome n=1 Tax=Agarivorans sp. TSD2052 TaxID=2937286 RepID=UPI00200D1B53|nr:c-type cytochrome [Agarivorans sp. TSD2052]UPW17899.1 c-type cytochrome [Agarivorans sp. TSD2052]